MRLALRTSSLVLVAIALALALGHDPGRPHTTTDVLLAHPVLALAGACALLLMVVFLPSARSRRGARGGRTASTLGKVLAVAFFVGGTWLATEIDDAHIAAAMLVLGPALGFVAWGRAARIPGPFVAGTLTMAGGAFVLGVQLASGELGRPVWAFWGDEQTFEKLFPKSPPYIKAGGRLRPDLDLYMFARHLPQGARLRTNAQGFRNTHEVTPQPAPGVLRVLNLGDSFSIGMQIDQREFFGALVERELARLRSAPVEVLNPEVSDPAYGTYYFQEHGSKLEADIVLLGMCGNDLMQADDWFGVAGETRIFQPAEDGRIDADPKRSVSAPHYERYAEHAYPRSSQTGAAYERQAQRVGGFAHFQSAKLFRLEVVRWLLPNTARRASVPMAMHSFADGIERSDGRKRYFDGVSNLGYFATDAPPVMELMDRLYAKLGQLLAILDRQVSAAGGRLVLVLHPQRFQVHAEDWAVVRDLWELDDDDFDLDLYNRRMRALCAERGILCCDLLPALRAEADGGSLYIPGGDVHYNNAGHAVAARATAAFLERELGF